MPPSAAFSRLPSRSSYVAQIFAPHPPPHALLGCPAFVSFLGDRTSTLSLASRRPQPRVLSGLPLVSPPIRIKRFLAFPARDPRPEAAPDTNRQVCVSFLPSFPPSVTYCLTHGGAKRLPLPGDA
ncbi:hypothetical protein R3P38DRAFT_3246814 [Favolaschia claudopus]|uniref:Uncharacterized protein n=1 Tax=Favolaschia claudopus TaxID=2862362 RepID=A0AAV9YYR5_9AGAR